MSSRAFAFQWKQLNNDEAILGCPQADFFYIEDFNK
jgi:hypothetical protein